MVGVGADSSPSDTFEETFENVSVNVNVILFPSHANRDNMTHCGNMGRTGEGQRPIRRPETDTVTFS